MEGFPWDDLPKILPGCQQMAKVPYGVETLRKISIVWVGRRNVTDDRRQTDGRWHIANVNLSSRSLKSKVKKGIAVCRQACHHRYGNSHTIWDHTVLPATRQSCVQTNEDTIVRFSASGITSPLVSGGSSLSGYSQEITPSGGVKVRHPSIDSENSTNNRSSLGNGAR